MNERRTFLDKNFLLYGDEASQLYQEYAQPCAILDYHNHLSPKDIAENRRFNNLTEIWLEGDHYKWRAMRINGVDERFITGNASPKDKFLMWAKTVPATLRNPLYHWTHLELKRYFDVHTLLDENTASDIYDHCSNLLQREDFHVQSLLSKMKVEVVCTTDDPTDSLEYHSQFATQSVGFKIYPTFRPDKAFATADPKVYNSYLEKLAHSASIAINTFDDLIAALYTRMDFFQSLGCRVSDHGLESLWYDKDMTAKAPDIFKKVRSGNVLDVNEQHIFQGAVMAELCKGYHQRGWVQQFHIGPIRNNNTRLLKQLGPDTGFDSIGDFSQAVNLSRFLDHLDQTNQLAKTILYNINPSDNEVFATMVGNFSDGSTAGKIQWGSGWWFLDQKDGMEKQMNTLSNMGLLSQFVGMVTDSRSFLSFPRHEYFRRILCNLFGGDISRGELPHDIKTVGSMIQHICYHNAKNYFKF